MKRSNLYYILLLLLLSCSSCDLLFGEDDGVDEYIDPATLNREPLWESEQLYLQDPTVDENYGGGHSIYLHPIHNEVIMFGYSGIHKDKRMIGLDVKTGRIKNCVQHGV